MVALNFISSLLVFFSLFFYRFIFPKKNIKIIIVLLLLSVLPLISILREGSYESGDLSINALKSMTFYDNLSEGEVIPRWAGELNATYGYPLFIFTYPLPYYTVSFFHFLGFSFIGSVKLLLIFSFIASAITAFIFLKDQFGERPALAGSLLYLFAPYHLLDLHFRVAIGEMMSFIFLPLILFLLRRLLMKPNGVLFSLTSLSVGLLLLSHQAISLVFVPFCAIYVIFLKHISKNPIKYLSVSLISIVIGLLLASFYILPVIYYGPITLGGGDISFSGLKYFLLSPWRFGFLFQGPYGELSFPLGFIQTLFLAIGFWIAVGSRFKGRKILIFYLLSFIVLFFMLLSPSRIVWQTLPFIHNFQFSYRLMVIISLLVSVVAAIVSVRLNKKLLAILCILAILSTILNWGNRRSIPEIDDAYLKKELPLATARGEGLGPAMPIWTKLPNIYMKEVPTASIEIKEGDGKLAEILRKNTSHVYVANIKKDSILKENTLYFPGWNVAANKRNIKITGYNPIEFRLPKGLYVIEVTFKPTLIINISLLITASAIFFLIVITFFSREIGKFAKRFPKFGL